MKAHKYWSLGALAAMIGTFYTGYKNMKTAHKYFACSSLLCMIMAIYSGHKMISGKSRKKKDVLFIEFYDFFEVCDVASSAYLPHSGKSRLGCEAGTVMKFVFIPFVYCWRTGS